MINEIVCNFKGVEKFTKNSLVTETSKYQVCYLLGTEVHPDYLFKPIFLG